MLRNDCRRITLITRGTRAPERQWDTSPAATQRIIFVPSLTVLQYALANGVTALQEDIGRVILDHSATAAEYLQLLATLPAQFAGDVLLMTDAGTFVSAVGRGGDRVLHSLGPADVEFYLDVNGLLAARSECGGLPPLWVA